jgi:hypothetical protein
MQFVGRVQELGLRNCMHFRWLAGWRAGDAVADADDHLAEGVAR